MLGRQCVASAQRPPPDSAGSFISTEGSDQTMFKLVEERTAWQPVKFRGLTEDGEAVDNQIEMRFLLLSTDANLKLLQEAGELTIDTKASENGDAAEGEKLSAVMARFGMKIIRDWRGVHEANEDPIKFNEENLARLFNVPGTFEAALKAYREAAMGGKDARAGN